jgi:hypothetical protein
MKSFEGARKVRRMITEILKMKMQSLWGTGAPTKSLLIKLCSPQGDPETYTNPGSVFNFHEAKKLAHCTLYYDKPIFI